MLILSSVLLVEAAGGWGLGSSGDGGGGGGGWGGGGGGRSDGSFGGGGGGFVVTAVHGIPNPSNTICYMSSMLQCLMSLNFDLICKASTIKTCTQQRHDITEYNWHEKQDTISVEQQAKKKKNDDKLA